MGKTVKAKSSSQHKKETPLMKQYHQLKGKYPDAILLFRVGDFYETFGEDAVIASRVLGIVLTKRHNGAANEIELAGFPHHAMDTYLPKLVRAGYRVAICDQLEDPKKTKKLVKRGVTELVTPGVSYNDQVLQQKSNNFLAAVHFGPQLIGLSFLDISTGEFLLAEGNADYINKLIQSFSPSEILFQKQFKTQFETHFGNAHFTYMLEDWVFYSDFAQETLNNHFQTQSLKGFGVQGMEEGIIAAGAALHYLADTRHDRLKHIAQIKRIDAQQFVWLDRFTIRNLELLSSPNASAHTLVDILDKTLSPMGGRMMKRWIALPLKDKKVIDARLQAVEYFLKSPDKREELNALLYRIGDLERLVSKVSTARINPREMVQLKNALSIVPKVKSIGEGSSQKALKALANKIDNCQSCFEQISKTIQEEAPVQLSQGNVILEGVNAELDELRSLKNSGKDLLKAMQEREVQRTGISSLKIAFNNVFGYYIEVRNTHKDKVPEDWIRKQTLVNAERYITEELKGYESKILGAEEKILALEGNLFKQLIEGVSAYLKKIQDNAVIIAQMDCLSSFATVAEENALSLIHI